MTFRRIAEEIMNRGYWKTSKSPLTKFHYAKAFKSSSLRHSRLFLLRNYSPSHSLQKPHESAEFVTRNIMTARKGLTKPRMNRVFKMISLHQLLHLASRGYS